MNFEINLIETHHKVRLLLTGKKVKMKKVVSQKEFEFEFSNACSQQLFGCIKSSHEGLDKKRLLPTGR